MVTNARPFLTLSEVTRSRTCSLSRRRPRIAFRASTPTAYPRARVKTERHLSGWGRHRDSNGWRGHGLRGDTNLHRIKPGEDKVRLWSATRH